MIAGTANAQNNDIVKWGDGDQGDHFNIVDSEGTIEILRGDGFNYKFYATDTAHMTGLGVINIITIATTVTGSFTILIDHETPGLRGAREWGVADLRHPNWPTDTCTIAGIDVVEVVLRYDPPGLPPPIENILCDAINGDIDIGTLAPIRPGDALARKLEAGAVVGSIFIESFRGDLNFASLTGNITTGAGTPERTPGDITIRSSYGGTITFNDPEGYVGRVHIVNGNFSGRIDFPTGEMFGAVEIDGDFIVPGRIVCGTNAYFDRENGGDPPSVHVHGSLANPNSIPSDQPMITSGFQSPDGGLRGLIAIDGDLQNAVTAGPEILVWIIRDPFEDPPGEFTARGAIAVDYDGWDDGDDWEAGATVEEWIPPVVNPTVNVYDENTPGKSVYEITPCRGDANNDGQVTSADIYGLTLARLLPDIGYSETDISDCFVDNYSGLEGSILWHGDWDCSNDITCVDANLHRWFLVN